MFTEEEHEEFEACYEEGDTSDNPRYRTWVQMYHTDSDSGEDEGDQLSDSLLSDSPLPKSYQPALKQSSIKQLWSKLSHQCGS